MRIIVAPQEFKGTLTAHEAADAMAIGVERALPDATVEAIPLSDGGPGLVDVILASTGGRRLHAQVQDPLGRPIEAAWALLDDRSAVIESAAAAGLVLLCEDERDPAVTSTFGVGQLILAALEAGCKRVTVGLGGSATNDGGAGMAAALGVRFLDAGGRDLPPGGAALAGLDRIDISGLDPHLRDVAVLAAADVTNPLCGPEGASLLYGPQKGASPALAQQLDAALHRYAEIVERDVGMGTIDKPGAGAAGGLGAGVIAFTGAEVRPGFDIVAEAVQLRGRLAGADLIVTGEGCLDAQTVHGKAVMGVAQLAADGGTPVLVVPGSLAPGWEAILSCVHGVEPVVGSTVTEAQAMERPAQTLSTTVERALHGWRAMGRISADA